MTADRPAPRKKPDVTATFLSDHNAALKAAATHRLAELAHYAFGEGFLPDIAAIAAGYKNREAAYRAAKNAGRPALAAALTNPTPAEKRAAQIEDIEFLLDHGEAAERAALRCGFTSLDMAVHMLRKWGRTDLSGRLLDLAPKPDRKSVV